MVTTFRRCCSSSRSFAWASCRLIPRHLRTHSWEWCCSSRALRTHGCHLMETSASRGQYASLQIPSYVWHVRGLKPFCDESIDLCCPLAHPRISQESQEFGEAAFESDHAVVIRSVVRSFSFVGNGSWQSHSPERWDLSFGYAFIKKAFKSVVLGC